MQTVSIIWYRVYYWWMVGFSLLVAAGSVAVYFLPRLGSAQNSLGLTTTALVLAAIQLVYSLTIYWLVKRRNRSGALLVASLLFWFVLIYGLQQSTGHAGSYVYVVGWWAAIGFGGLYGSTMLLSSSFATVAYVLIVSKFNLHAITTQEYVLLAGLVGVAIASWWFWRQISEQHNATQNNRLSSMLRTSQEQSEIIIQSIADGVIVFDTAGKISLINAAAAVLTEWNVKDALGVDIRLVMKLFQESGQPLGPNDDVFTMALTTKQHLTRTVQLHGHVSKQTDISLVVSPLIIAPNNNLAGGVVVFRDVTKDRQEERQRADFISTASHEMRTPVAAIEGYLALALNDKVSTIDSKARNYLEKAHESTEHLGQLFQDLLTSSKAEDGRLSSHPVVVEIGSFLQQLADDLRLVAQRKQLALEFTTGSSSMIDATRTKSVQPLYYTSVDPDRLREVITNLFDNAVKYTDEGKITIGLTGDNAVVQVYVKDTGAGIPAEDIPHLFQKFYRVDNSATRSTSGTGLGLFICRKIVELYQGRIWVESQLGQGSTFFISLPRLSTQRAEQLRSAQSKALSAVKSPIPTMTLTGS